MIILILRSQMRSVGRLFMIMSRDVIQATMRAAAAATRACMGRTGGDWRRGEGEMAISSEVIGRGKISMREGGSHIPHSFKFAHLSSVMPIIGSRESCPPFIPQRALSYSAQYITGEEETVQRRGGILAMPASLSL